MSERRQGRREEIELAMMKDEKRKKNRRVKERQVIRNKCQKNGMFGEEFVVSWESGLVKSLALDLITMMVVKQRWWRVLFEKVAIEVLTEANDQKTAVSKQPERIE
jgi:hypothetical protein